MSSFLVVAPLALGPASLLLRGLGVLEARAGGGLEGVDDDDSERLRLLVRHTVLTIDHLILVEDSKKDGTTAVDPGMLGEVVGARKLLSALAAREWLVLGVEGS